jgi:quinoprotein glucose dehydrogenase
VAQLDNPNGPWGTIVAPEGQGGSNWTGGSYDPETGVFYVYSKSNLQVYGPSVRPDGKLGNGLGINGVGRGTNDNMGANYLGGPVPTSAKDALTDPIVPGMLSIGGLSLLKPPYGRITALDLKKGTMLWQVAHGETPDFIKNNPLLKGLTIPRTGQSGILGVLTTKSLVICGDSGGFTDDKGRKAARFRAYDKATGQEVGAVVMDQPQTGSPMTFMLAGRQHIVVASSGANGGEFICYRLPGFPEPPAARRGGGGEPPGGGQPD